MLGSGGAFRLPYPSCHCPNCEAARRDPALRRTTTSLWVRDGASLLLDAGPDLYHQALREGVERVDGILITHLHRDHMLGLECLETIVRYGQAGRAAQVYGPPDLVREAAAQFGYQLDRRLMELRTLEPNVPADILGFRVTPFAVAHHDVTTYGYCVARDGRSLVYVPDVKALPGGGSLAADPLPPAMTGADLFFVDATFDEARREGAGHITWQQAAALGQRSGAGRTVLVHISHWVDIGSLRRATNERLLEGHDGQRFTL